MPKDTRIFKGLNFFSPIFEPFGSAKRPISVMQINHANWRNPTEIKMFNSAFKNTAMSTLIATLVATTLSTVPAVAGEGGGGNTDRLIMKYYKQIIEHQEGDRELTEADFRKMDGMTEAEEELLRNSEDYTLTYGLENEFSDYYYETAQEDDDDDAYSVGAGYRFSPRFSGRYDR